MEDKTTEQLLQEIANLRQRLAELEAAEAEHKRTEEALRSSLALFHSLIESLPQNIFSKDLEGRFTFANQRYCMTEGKSLADILGKTDFDLHPPELAEKYRQDDRWVIENRRTLELEEEHQPKNGERFHVQVIKTPIYDANGQVTGVLGIFWDITESKRAEEERKARLKQLTALSRASQVVTASLELDQVLAEIVSLASEVTASDYTSVVLADEAGHMGRSAENIPGIPAIKYRVRERGITDWVFSSRQAVIVDKISEDGTISPVPGEGAPPTANPHIIKAGVKSFAGLPLEVKGRLLGVLYLHSLRPRAFHDQMPLLTAFANQTAIAIENARLYEALKQELAERKRAEEALIRNLEERLAAEAALRESEERFRRLAENAPDLIYRYEFTPQRGFTYVSPAATAVTGYTPEEHYADPDLGLKIVHPDDRLLLEQYFQGEGAFREPIVLRWIRKDGQIIWTEQRNVPVYDEAGNLVAMEGIARDITERKRAEEEIRQRIEQLSTLLHVSQSLTATLDLATVLQTITEGAANILNLETTAIYLLEGEELYLGATTPPLPSHFPESFRHASLADHPHVREAISTGLPVILPDTKTANLTDAERAISEARGLRTILYMPLIVDEQKAGVLILGTVSEPRTFSKDQIDLCRTLSNQAAIAINNARLHEALEQELRERKRAEEALRESQALLSKSQAMAHVGSWELDLVINRLTWSDEVYRIFGLRPQEFGATYEAFLETVHPDDRAAVDAAYTGSLREGRDTYEIEHRIIRRDNGEIRFVHEKCEHVKDASGQIVRSVGMVQDITERKLLQQRLLTIHALGQKLVLLQKVEEIAQQVTDAALAVLRFPVCDLWLADEKSRMLTRICQSPTEPILALPSLPLDSDRGIIATAVRSGQAIYLPDVDQDPRYIRGSYPSRSELCVPLKVRERTIGALNAESVHLDAFSPADVQLLEALANAAAVALENARLYEERAQQTAQLELINRIGQELTTTLDMPTLARITYQHISRLMDAPHMVISRYDPQTRLIRADFAIVDGEETDVSAFPPIPLEPDTGLQSKVIVRGQPLIVDDLQAQLRQVQTVHYIEESETNKPKSALYAPLLAGERVVGTLNVQSYKLRAYSEEDARLLTTIASQLALAIENARLFQAEQKRAEQLAIINELGQALAVTLDLPTVYRTAGKYVQRLVDCPNFAISLFDQEQQVLTMTFCLSDGVELDPALFPPLPHNPQAQAGRGKAIASGQPTFVHDLPKAAQSCGKVSLIGEGPEPQSALYIPMLVEGQVIGLMELQSYQPHAYSQEDADLLTTATNQIGLSIQNARLFKETYRLKEFNESIVQNMSEGIAIEDAEGYFTFVNPAAEAMLGYTPGELIGQHWSAIILSDQQPIVRAADERRRRGIADSYELELVRKDGTRLPVLVSGSPRFENGRFAGTLALFADISELKRLEAQLLQSQKMEAIGRLAGGVAHDFNNLLTAIIGYSEFLLHGLNSYDPRRGDVEEIRKAADRAAALTRQLLAFSRKQVLQPEVLNLNAIVVNLEKMLQRLLGEDIELVTALDPHLGRVKADPGQIEQVIVNLAVNARDAMPQGGKLTVETVNVYLDEDYAHQHTEVQPGPYVMLAVSDTGVGMDEETKSHLFEPFFTTKELGRGTGLGLSTVYGIVKQSGGHITVYSEPGLGTTFKIYLPQTEESGETAVRAPTRPAALHGQETILVVEDAEPVRDMARQVLVRQGYTVLEAQNGEEALRLNASHEGPIHLLVTDVVMPGGMSGRQLAERLTATRPEMRVLYMSGYTDNAIVHRGLLEPGIAFLQKPFAPDTLTLKVRETLDAP